MMRSLLIRIDRTLHCSLIYSVGLEHHMQLSSVCPLETLHNSLSLKQIDEFFGRISQHYMRTMEFNVRQNSPASKRFIHKDLSDHSGYSRSASNPSSNVSSAWPSPENTRHTFDLTKIMNKLQVSTIINLPDLHNVMLCCTLIICLIYDPEHIVGPLCFVLMLYPDRWVLIHHVNTALATSYYYWINILKRRVAITFVLMPSHPLMTLFLMWSLENGHHRFLAIIL